MARRQKGPTPEEMIEKLEESFSAFKEEYTKQLEEVKNDNNLAIVELRDDHEKEIYPYGGPNLSKISAFSQEISVKDICVRRKSTIKSHPGR